MPKPSKPKRTEPSIFKLWFNLTEQEQWFISGIVAIALIGLTARYFYLKSLEPEAFGIKEAPTEIGAPQR